MWNATTKKGFQLKHLEKCCSQFPCCQTPENFHHVFLGGSHLCGGYQPFLVDIIQGYQAPWQHKWCYGQNLLQFQFYIEANIFGIGAIDHKLSDKEMTGNCCAVRINDMHWLRGKITDVVRKSEMKYSVLLIDYGSLALLQPDRVPPHSNILLWNDNQCFK